MDTQFIISKEDPRKTIEILNLLGRGSYGEVFKGRNRLTSEIVAVKSISVDEGESSLESLCKVS